MNRYQILRSVGEGAYGTVYKCKSVGTGELVAIKRFNHDLGDDLMTKSIIREITILRSVQHENIVLLREAFRKKERLHIVFEFVDKNLLQVLNDRFPTGFPSELARRSMWQLLSAVEHCHSHGVIHRDIKPENVLIKLSSMSLKLCDFGFARTISQPESGDLTDYVATRWYRAPELLLGMRNYGFEVDIFAAGCVMGEIHDGQPLLPGDSELHQLRLIESIIGPLDWKEVDGSSCRGERLRSTVSLTEPLRAVPIHKRYMSIISDAGLSLLTACLVTKPSRRIQAEEALKHSYFTGIKPRDESTKYQHTLRHVTHWPIISLCHSPIKNAEGVENKPVKDLPRKGNPKEVGTSPFGSSRYRAPMRIYPQSCRDNTNFCNSKTIRIGQPEVARNP